MINFENDKIRWLNFNEYIILKKADGSEKEIVFEEPRPDWILIKATKSRDEWWYEYGYNKPSSGNHGPPDECFDRFDLNKRGIDSWEKRFWKWLNEEMKNFSNGMAVRAYGYNPYYAIAGFSPDV